MEEFFIGLAGLAVTCYAIHGILNKRTKDFHLSLFRGWIEINSSFYEDKRD